MLIADKINKTVHTGDTELNILKEVSFKIEEGTSLAILGESGSGKTTLLGILAGLDEPSSGNVFLGEDAIFDLNEDKRAEIRKNSLGFVFQNFQLIEGLTALENVMMPLELKGEQKAKERATEILQNVGLGERLQHYPNQLSGGEQQRVAISRAFVTKPKLLLADEPTGNLDTRTGETIIKLMFDINKNLNTTLILVTHDTHLASLCDQSLTLSAGRIVELSNEKLKSN